MNGPYIVRIVMADGVARYLFQGNYLSWRGSKYKHLRSARKAARKYIGDGKHLGTYHVDFLDESDPETVYP